MSEAIRPGVSARGRARSVPRILNPAGLVEWNTDKAYLRELEEAGLPVIPTIWLDPARKLSSRAVHTRMPASGDFVIKPTVSRGSRDTGRYEAGEAHSRGLAISHAVSLMKEGRHVMIQRYLPEIAQGDKRVLVIAGEPVPYSLARIPKAGESRGNLAAGVAKRT